MALTTAWSAIHEAATTVGVIARIDMAHLSLLIDRGLQVTIGPCADAALRDDMQDLADVLQRGIAALLYAHTSGGSPDAAARALWADFLAARDAISTRLA